MMPVRFDDLDYVKRIASRKNKYKESPVYYYSVAPGMKRVPIPYPIGDENDCSADFVNFVLRRNERAREAIAARKQGDFSPLPPRGTIEHLSIIYMGSEEHGIQPHRNWARLKAKSKKDYLPYIKEIVRRFGEFHVSDMCDEVAEEFRDTMGGVVDGLPTKPYAGNNALSALKAMYKVAKSKTSIFELTTNPVRDVGKFGRKEGVKARQKFWFDSHEKLFMQKANEHDPEIGKCMLSFMYTGQRPMDCLLMLPSVYDGIRIHVVQEKTSARLPIKAHKKVKPMFDAAVARSKRLARIGDPVIDLKFEGADLYSHMSKRWDDIMVMCIEEYPTMKGLQRRDVRRTAVVRLSEVGCTVPEIASVTGHTIQSVHNILEHYLVRTKKMADNAIDKYNQYEGE